MQPPTRQPHSICEQSLDVSKTSVIAFHLSTLSIAVQYSLQSFLFLLLPLPVFPPLESIEGYLSGIVDPQLNQLTSGKMDHTEADLLAWMQPDETAAEFLRRTVTESLSSGIALVDQHTSLRPGQVLEIVGRTGSGKSELLMQARGAGEGGGRHSCGR